MANKPIEMSKIRQIMKLYIQRIGKKKIGERLGISKNTVKVYIDIFFSLQRPWDELSLLTDYELDHLFHPPKENEPSEKIKQIYAFFPTVEKQMRKRGMVLNKQYERYKAQYPDGYKHSSFHVHYQLWRKKKNPSMPITHIVGDKVYVDYAGETLSYVDEVTGEVKEAQVFVAILGWSQYAYVEAMRNQTIGEFVAGCENALRYFQGVPLAIVPDNLKSAVIKASRYEPIVNENFQAFAEHYGMAVLPTRVRKPKDKAHVENMVKLAYKEIYTEVVDFGTLSLKRLNEQIHFQLDRFNQQNFKGKDYSRQDEWMMERSSLNPLPESLFEMRKIKQVTVMKTSHVYLSEDDQYYSVPYAFIGQKLKMHYTQKEVTLYNQYQLIAVHPRQKTRERYTTLDSHMPTQNQFISEWSPKFFIDKALAIDEIVADYIHKVLESKLHPEQGYKACNGILSFSKRVGNPRLIRACRRAKDIGYYNYKIIEDILKRNLDQLEEESAIDTLPTHDNIRGQTYYQ
jgi:transposase